MSKYKVYQKYNKDWNKFLRMPKYINLFYNVKIDFSGELNETTHFYTIRNIPDKKH